MRLDGGPTFGEASGDQFFSIEYLICSRFNDVLVGVFGSDIEGGGGNDILISTGYGFGTSEGGRGDDVINVNNTASEFIIFNPGDGNDTIIGIKDEDEIFLTNFGFGSAIDALNRATEIDGDVFFDFLGGDTLLVRDTTKIELVDDLTVFFF